MTLPMIESMVWGRKTNLDIETAFRRALETEHEKMHADQVQSMGTMRTVQEQRCSSPSMRCLEGDVSASLVAQHQLPTADKRGQVRVTRKKMI